MSVSRYFVVKTHSIRCHSDGNNQAAVRENPAIKPIKMSVKEVVLLLYDVLTNKIFSWLYHDAEEELG